MYMKKLYLTALPLLALSAPAFAADTSYPNISGSLTIEIENDNTFKSDDKNAELNDLYPTLTLETSVGFTSALSVNLEATLEPIADATNDRAFEDLGAYANILTINYDTDLFSVYGGKFTPNFGIAWDATPGIFGTNLNEDYELAEMLGVGGGVNFNAAGSHTLSASSFLLDTTFLSDSVINSRGPIKQSDGGAANTDGLSSFAVALDGEFEQLDGFRYHLGVTSLAEGSDGTENQIGYAIGGEYEIALTEEVTLTPLAEYVYLDNTGGIDGNDSKYLTAGVSLGYGSWSASTSYQSRKTDVAGTETSDFIADLTIGYAFDFGLELAGGYMIAEDAGVDSQGFGILAAYTIDF
jgi:opacity protein-like surface antigen